MHCFFGVLMNESMLFVHLRHNIVLYKENISGTLSVYGGAAAALSRMLGILLAIPAAVEWLEHLQKYLKSLKNKDIKNSMATFSTPKDFGYF